MIKLYKGRAASEDHTINSSARTRENSSAELAEFFRRDHCPVC